MPIGSSPLHIPSPCRTITGSTMLSPSLPTLSRLRYSYSSGQPGTLGLSAWPSGYSLSVSTPPLLQLTVNSVGPTGFTYLSEITDCAITEYWLASLKVVTIIVFIIIGIVVNAGGNTSHEYIGGKNWTVGDAPFVGGFGGFARVFVTASFACECQKLFI